MDAYTLRKIAPRILIGVIGINLSIYLCVAAIDITNVIGNGIGQLLRGPFLHAESFNAINGIQIQPNTENTIVGVGVGVVGIGSIVAAFFAPGVVGAAVLGALGMLFPLLLSGLLLFIAILAVVVLRYGILIFLTVISPVAMACFILPGTEKYFRQWWDIFTKTLLVYPIIAVFFALSDILAAIFLQSQASDATSDSVGLVGLFVALIALIAPLFMIPFAFKFAGGVIGQIAGVADGFRDRASKSGFVQSRKDRARQNLRNRSIEARAEYADRLKGRGSKVGHRRLGAARSGLYNLAARRVGGYNIEALASAARAEKAKELNDQINTGRDEEVRGLTVNKQWALANGGKADKPGGEYYTDASGRRRLADWRMTEDGRRQFRSLGGRWMNEADVDNGHRRWGRDTFAQQAALSYEMRKAQTDEELGRLAQNYHHVAGSDGGWGNTDTQAGGAWIGAAFENQNQHLEYKYTDWQTGSMTPDQAKAFATEVYEKRGSYPMAQMSAHTFGKLKDAYDQAGVAGDEGTQDKVRAIAETFVYRGGSEPGRIIGEGEEAHPEPTLPTETPPVARGRAEQLVRTSTQGAGHVAEAARDLAVHTGIYQPDNRTHSESPRDNRTLPPNPQA